MDFISAYIHSMTTARELELRPRHPTSAYVSRPTRRRRLRRRDRTGPAGRQRIEAELRALAPTAPDAALDAAAGHADVLDIPAGRTLVHHGQVPRQVVVIRSGRVIETSPGGSTRELAPGSVVGARDVDQGEPASHTVHAETEVSAVVIHAPAYLALSRP